MQNVWVSRHAECVGESSCRMCGWVVMQNVWVSRHAECVGGSSCRMCG